MALPQLFSIGEMAKIFHLSVSSLRHYEALGLVTPEYVDPSTNYRYYSVRQFEPLNTIRYLRAMDMPLTEIADFLQNRDDLHHGLSALADEQRCAGDEVGLGQYCDLRRRAAGGQHARAA